MTCKEVGLHYRSLYVGNVLVAFLVLLLFLFVSSWSSVWATDCKLSWMSFQGDMIQANSHHYTFSGSCATQSSKEDVRNFGYTVTGKWTKSTKRATEKVITPYGDYLGEFQCDYDPWLEPNGQCTKLSITWSPVATGWAASLDFHVAYRMMNGERMFPVSPSALNQGYRADTVVKVMARSLKIIDPVQNQYFKNTNIPITVVMENPVINPPNYAVQIKVEEVAWPEPGKQPKKYHEGKNFVNSGEQLVTYFNLKGKNLWNSQWRVSAHFVASDPYWTPYTFFKVASKASTLSVSKDNKLDTLQAQQPLQELKKPIIYSPRANRTYHSRDKVPLQISFQKGTTLHVQISYKGVGDGSYKILKEEVYTDGNLAQPGFLSWNSISVIALVAEADEADIQIKAWVSGKLGSKPGLSLESRSEVAQRETRFLVDKLVITNPVEGRKYGVPAKVAFAIPFFYDEIDLDYEKYVEVEMHRAIVGDNVVSPFKTYSGEYVSTRSNKTVFVIYNCEDKGLYRFRMRFVFPPIMDAPGFSTLWTDWREIDVTKPIGLPIDISSLVNKPTLHLKQFPLGGEPETAGEENSIKPSMTEKLKVEKTMADKVRRKHLSTLLFIQPRQAQKFARIGSIPFRLQGADNEKNLVYQLEIKEFESSSFKKLNMGSTYLTAGNGYVSGKFKVTREGDYRIRVREINPDTGWSNWVKFTVGEPELKKSLRQIGKLEKKQLSQKKSAKQIKPQKAATNKPLAKKPVKPVSTKKKKFQMK